MIKVNVTQVAWLGEHGGFFVLLGHADDKRVLPIGVDVSQAQAIKIQLDGIQFPRPLTHDLFKNVMDEMGCKLVRVEICGLEQRTFYARLILSHDGTETEIDARPSDAIALALRCAAAILVDEEVMGQAAVSIRMPGKTAAKKGGLTQVEVLERQLKQAIKEEHYEKAAELRDQIKLEQEKIKQQPVKANKDKAEN